MPEAQQATDGRIEALQQTLLQALVQTEERLLEQARRETVQLSDQLNLALRDLTLLTARQLEYQRETRLLLGQLSLPPSDAWSARLVPGEAAPETMIFPHSTVCRQESFETPYFPYWAAQIGHELRYHRKLWEFVFCGSALKRDPTPELI
jgi:hypothetical protein